MASVVGLEVEGRAFPVGDKGVVVVDGNEGELAAGVGRTADDEAHLTALAEGR